MLLIYLLTVIFLLCHFVTSILRPPTPTATFCLLLRLTPPADLPFCSLPLFRWRDEAARVPPSCHAPRPASRHAADADDQMRLSRPRH